MFIPRRSKQMCCTCVCAGNRRIGPVRAEMLPPPVNNTGRMNCGVSGFESSGRECDLTPQPCYYVVTVGTVFKGNYTVS